MKGALLLVSLSLLPPHSNLHLFWPNYRILLLLQFPEICLQFVSSFVSKRGHCKIHYDELPLRYWATQFAVHYFEFCIFHFPRKNISQIFGYSKATWRRQHFQKHLQHHNIKPTSILPVRHRTTTQRIEGGNAFIAKINKCCSAEMVRKRAYNEIWLEKISQKNSVQNFRCFLKTIGRNIGQDGGRACAFRP